jgi:hypothetical protein
LSATFVVADVYDAAAAVRPVGTAGGRDVPVSAGAAAGAADVLDAGFRGGETVRYGVTAAPDLTGRLLRA